MLMRRQVRYKSIFSMNCGGNILCCWLMCLLIESLLSSYSMKLCETSPDTSRTTKPTAQHTSAALLGHKQDKWTFVSHTLSHTRTPVHHHSLCSCFTSLLFPAQLSAPLGPIVYSMMAWCVRNRRCSAHYNMPFMQLVHLPSCLHLMHSYAIL